MTWLGQHPMAPGNFQTMQQEKAIERIDKQLAKMAEEGIDWYYPGDVDDLLDRRLMLQAALEQARAA